MRLFIFSPLSPAARAYLHEHLPAGHDVTFRDDQPTDPPPVAFQQAEALLGNVPPAWLATGAPPSLRFWQIDSAGFERYRRIELQIPVANMGDFFAWPCAETVLAGLLALYRRIPELAVFQAERRWVGGAFVRNRAGLLRGKRVIILGAGAIAQALRQQLGGFGCPVQLLARTNPSAELHSKAELLGALPEADIVVNTLPGSADGFFSAELVAAMRSSSVYASVGRGNTTDEAALLAALQAGHLGGAVLDVTATEPLPAASPLWALPNVLLTQHTAGGQPLEDEGKVDVFLQNLAHFQANEPLANLIDLSRGY